MLTVDDTCLFMIYLANTTILKCMCVFFQGGVPTPFDRLCGTRQAVKSFNYLLGLIENSIDANGM